MKERLTSIETLPESALSDCQWLYDTIKAKRRSQTDMLDEFNQRLVSSGHTPISRSGLNRYVMKVRESAVKRPAAVPLDGSGTSVFTEVFRAKLVEAQGINAVMMLEAAITLLARKSGS